MRGHGRKWEFVVDLGRNPGSGKRQQKWHTGYATKRAAEKALAEVLRQLDGGTYVDPSKQTLGEYLVEQWLPSRKPKAAGTGRGHRGQVGIGTWASYWQEQWPAVVSWRGWTGQPALA